MIERIWPQELLYLYVPCKIKGKEKEKSKRKTVARKPIALFTAEENESVELYFGSYIDAGDRVGLEECRP